jgi:hypothetical protein
MTISMIYASADGEPVKDLNDLLKIITDSYTRNAKVIDKVMRFSSLYDALVLFAIRTPLVQPVECPL